jgi:hypothetical protein
MNTYLLNTATGNRANISCPSVGLPKLVSQWFDTSCFNAPTQYVFGNSGKGHVRGPGVLNFDLSAFKRFHFDEKRAGVPLRVLQRLQQSAFQQPAGDLRQQRLRPDHQHHPDAQGGPARPKVHLLKMVTSYFRLAACLFAFAGCCSLTTGLRAISKLFRSASMMSAAGVCGGSFWCESAATGVRLSISAFKRSS